MTQDYPAGPDGLAGLEDARDQIAAWLIVVRAERARILAGAQVRRRAWKNALFTGPPGSGKSRAAAALAQAYHELGALPFGRVHETAAASLAGTPARRTADLVHDAALRGGGGVLLITGAHAWRDHPDGGAHMLRALYEELSEARQGLAVVLTGELIPVAELMGVHPPLAARFPLIVNFPGYSESQLDRVFAALAAEAGFTLEPAAAEKAAAVLAAARNGHGSGRLAVALLGQAAIAQARRLGEDSDPLLITAADIPGEVALHVRAAEGPGPGLYLLGHAQPRMLTGTGVFGTEGALPGPQDRRVVATTLHNAVEGEPGGKAAGPWPPTSMASGARWATGFLDVLVTVPAVSITSCCGVAGGGPACRLTLTACAGKDEARYCLRNLGGRLGPRNARGLARGQAI